LENGPWGKLVRFRKLGVRGARAESGTAIVVIVTRDIDG